MEFTPEETEKLKRMLLFLVKRKHNESTGHCGFGLLELQSLLDEMEEAGEIVKKRTINSSKYFLK